MKSVSGREFARTVERRGWTLLGLAQSPHLREEREHRQLSVPIHGSKPLKIGLLRHLMKLAGLSEDDL